jgi:hypothetical protein
VARNGSDPSAPRADGRPVATREEQGPFGTPALRVEAGLTPYRSAANPGAPDRTHATALSEQRARRRWGLASGALSLAAFAAIPFALAESHFTATLAGMIGLGFASLASVSLRAYARERDASVAVFDHGMLIAMGGAHRTVPWESITRVQAEYAAADDGSLRVVAVTRVHTADGAILAIPRAVADPAALASTILLRTGEHLERAACQALEHGGVVRFGTVTATGVGIIAGSHLWAWDAVPALAVEGPFLHVYAKHDPMPPSTLLIEEQVDNLHVLLALLSRGYRTVFTPTAAAETPSSIHGSPQEGLAGDGGGTAEPTDSNQEPTESSEAAPPAAPPSDAPPPRDPSTESPPTAVDVTSQPAPRPR